MDRDTVILFTRNGLGDAPAELQQVLVTKFLSLTLESGKLPGKILFYTEGVKLVCEGSPVISQLSEIEKKGVELIICQTCLNYFNLADLVRVGVVGGMGDILTTLQMASRVISV
jgi:intracellular sulfur oxidation DsrE/DsrF family protein